MYRVKLNEICESGGVVEKFLINRGKGTVTTRSLGYAGKGVFMPMEEYLDKGLVLYTDSFHNSVSLAELMTQRFIRLC